MDDERYELLRRRRFSTAQIGYAPMAVDRLFNDLMNALRAGRELEPVVKAARLDKVSFGYDMAAVDEALNRVLHTPASEPGTQPVGQIPHTTTTVASTGPASPSPQPAAVAPTAMPPTLPAPAAAATGALSTAEGAKKEKVRPVPSLVLRPKRADAWVDDLIDDVTFPMARSGQQAYDVESVDDLMDSLEEARLRGVSITRIVNETRLPLATWGTQGYAVSEVDGFLDKLRGGDPRIVYSVTQPPAPNPHWVARTKESEGARMLFVVLAVFMLIVLVGIYIS